MEKKREKRDRGAGELKELRVDGKERVWEGEELRSK